MGRRPLDQEEKNPCPEGPVASASGETLRKLRFCVVANSCVPAFFRSRGEQAIVELALRQQLVTHAQKRSKPRLTRLDRALWVALIHLEAVPDGS